MASPARERLLCRWASEALMIEIRRQPQGKIYYRPLNKRPAVNFVNSPSASGTLSIKKRKSMQQVQ